MMKWQDLKGKFTSLSDDTKGAIEIKAKNAKVPLSQWELEDMEKVIALEQKTVRDSIDAMVECEDRESAKVIAETYFLAVMFTQQLVMAYEYKKQGGK